MASGAATSTARPSTRVKPQVHSTHEQDIVDDQSLPQHSGADTARSSLAAPAAMQASRAVAQDAAAASAVDAPHLINGIKPGTPAYEQDDPDFMNNLPGLISDDTDAETSDGDEEDEEDDAIDQDGAANGNAANDDDDHHSMPDLYDDEDMDYDMQSEDADSDDALYDVSNQDGTAPSADADADYVQTAVVQELPAEPAAAAPATPPASAAPKPVARAAPAAAAGKAAAAAAAAQPAVAAAAAAAAATPAADKKAKAAGAQNGPAAPLAPAFCLLPMLLAATTIASCLHLSVACQPLHCALPRTMLHLHHPHTSLPAPSSTHTTRRPAPHATPTHPTFPTPSRRLHQRRRSLLLGRPREAHRGGGPPHDHR
jgi:hypothetical protein